MGLKFWMNFQIGTTLTLLLLILKPPILWEYTVPGRCINITLIVFPYIVALFYHLNLTIFKSLKNFFPSQTSHRNYIIFFPSQTSCKNSYLPAILDTRIPHFLIPWIDTRYIIIILELLNTSGAALVAPRERDMCQTFLGFFWPRAKAPLLLGDAD